MGIWSNIKGVVLIHKDKKTSLESVVESIFDEYSLDYNTEDRGDSWEHTFSINFEEEGENAYYTANQFIRTLNQRKCTWQELEVNLRYV